MAGHSNLNSPDESDVPRAEIPPPPIPHRRWMLDGQDLSLSCEKIRPVSRAKHTHAEIKAAFTFEPASGIYTSWNVAGEPHDVRLTGRQAYCVGSNVPHALHWETEATLIEILLRPSYVATIPPDRLAAVLARESITGAIHDSVLWELAAKIRLLCSRPDQPDMRLLEPMAGSLVRRIFTNHAECYAPKPGPRLSEDRTQIVTDFMEENLANKIEANELAELVGLSVPHFTELFRNRTGKPPIEYLRELRRIEAHKKIFDGELRMGEIADACGFCDEPHLNREFKKFFHYTARLLRTRGQSGPGSEKTSARS